MALLAFSLLAAPLPVEAQQPANGPRVGILTPDTKSARLHLSEALREGLRDLGYVEGHNIVVEERWAEGRPERLPPLAAELVRLRVDVIVASTTPAILAAKQATSTIPIVMASAGDPVGSGLVASLARPGGNITGLSIMGPDLAGKRLQLLLEVVPGISRVAVLWDPANTALELRFREVQAAAKTLGVTLQSLEVRGPEELPNALAALAKEKPGALLATAPVAFPHRRQVMDFAAKNRLPVMYDTREYVEAGGLISYGPNFPDLYRRAAVFVDKILKGAKPADLPVEQPTKFELVINMKTAKALGLTIPRSVLELADQVIQ